MKTSHKIILPLAVFALVGVGAASTFALQTHAQAPFPNSATGNPVSNLVNAIASKFNLKTADVQQVFNDQRTQMEVKMQQKFTDRTNQAVVDGKLTRDQADKILAKQKELESQEEANKANSANLTYQQRQDARKAEIDSLNKWETDNNIPADYLQFGFKGHRGGHGPAMGMGMMGGNR